MRSATKLLLALATAAVVVFAASFPVRASESAAAATTGAPPARWDRATVELFARLPVQDGGRVKPLSTFAGFTLLALNGRREAKTPTGDRIDPTEWFLTCAFFPEDAARLECFVVEDSAVLDAAGLAHEGKARRDRYSYADLAPARGRIFELATQYAALDERRRNVVQGQLVHLAHNLQQFESLASLLGALGEPPAPHDSPALAELFGDASRPRIADVLERADDVVPALGVGSPHAASHADPALRAWIGGAVESSRAVALLPPPREAAVQAEWMTPSDLIERTLYRGEALPEQVAALRELDLAYASRHDAPALAAHARAFSERVVALSSARGEYRRIPLEVTFYRAQPFFWAQVAFVLSFLVAAVSWIRSSKRLTRTAFAGVAAATLLLAAGIAMRCVIRERPPVTTLYESILFVTAVGAIAAMAAEWLNRRGIALALATVIGSAGMFLANRYEMQERVDTMPSLVAVLDTNFWLAAHVTTVTIGYGASLLAGAVAHVHVLGRTFGAKRGDPGFYRTLESMTYGMLCFGLLFSVVGTVLGGIWANESWGRFWGWDPKENGALTIVLWQLIVLHARHVGWLRGFGVAMASVFGCVVVAASWWGVNLLGVGLHSYGFTSGVAYALLGFFAVEGLVLAAGGAHRWLLARATEVSNVQADV